MKNNWAMMVAKPHCAVCAEQLRCLLAAEAIALLTTEARSRSLRA
jgi:hypothetical protein